ncbi:MAG TPA: 30S ribosomal protein S8 [Saprospiraceae bacterium]|nr:30S ribosomal protein S8 [Saprospiraceae bacterium]
MFAFAVAQIKVASLTKRTSCWIRRNTMVLSLLRVLRSYGFIYGFTLVGNHILVRVRYKREKLGLQKLSVFSKRTNRVFLKRRQVGGKKVLGYYKTSGTMLFNTSSAKDLLTEWEVIMLGIGGEPVAVVS